MVLWLWHVTKRVQRGFLDNFWLLVADTQGKPGCSGEASFLWWSNMLLNFLPRFPVSAPLLAPVMSATTSACRSAARVLREDVAPLLPAATMYGLFIEHAAVFHYRQTTPEFLTQPQTPLWQWAVMNGGNAFLGCAGTVFAEGVLNRQPFLKAHATVRHLAAAALGALAVTAAEFTSLCGNVTDLNDIPAAFLGAGLYAAAVHLSDRPH